VFQSAPFFKVPNKPLYIFLLSAKCVTSPAHRILYDCLTEQHLVSSINHAALHIAAFYILLLPPSSKAQTSSSAPYSPTPSAYILPSV
jgi:hypothetical protein